VVVIDVGVPGMDAFRAARQIYEAALARGGVVLLTATDTDQELLDALRAGARGVLRRDSEPNELRRAARVVARGGAILAAGSARRVADHVLRRRDDVADAVRRLHVLTDREREVVALVGLGFANAQIAERLAVSPATVKAHVGNAMAKLDARDRAQLVMLAYETGLVHPAADAALGGTAETRL
jgi:DNA-binding NarL/FixJ family response regulator